METLELKNMATQVRRDIVRMVHAVQSGHPGGSLGCADFLTALYFKAMEHSNNFSMDFKSQPQLFGRNSKPNMTIGFRIRREYLGNLFD